MSSEDSLFRVLVCEQHLLDISLYMCLLPSHVFIHSFIYLASIIVTK